MGMAVGGEEGGELVAKAKGRGIGRVGVAKHVGEGRVQRLFHIHKLAHRRL